MRFVYAVIVFVLVCNACSGGGIKPEAVKAQITNTTSDSLNYADYGIQLKPATDYNSAKAAITRQRTALQIAYHANQVSLDSVSRYFTKAFVNTIIPHWYGTKWSFEGHTSVPGTGEIACGYLVSTTLNHCGVNINRYKVAQQTPYNEALTYACGDSVYVTASAAEVNSMILQSQFAEGLYFVGLSGSHVGLLLKRGERIFFIHSDYVDGKTVIEDAATSQVLAYYNRFYITALSGNQIFIKKWLANEAIVISA